MTTLFEIGPVLTHFLHSTYCCFYFFSPVCFFSRLLIWLFIFLPLVSTSQTRGGKGPRFYFQHVIDKYFHVCMLSRSVVSDSLRPHGL